MDVRDAVNDVRPEALSELLVALDLALGVVLEVAVALEAALDESAELGGEGVVVEEVVDAQAREGGLAGVCWADALLGGSDADEKSAYRARRTSESMYLEPPSSTSFKPSTIWWKSKTRCARSDTNRRPVQSSPENTR